LVFFQSLEEKSPLAGVTFRERPVRSEIELGE